MSRFAWNPYSPVNSWDNVNPYCADVERLLNLFQVSRIVVGHTPDLTNQRPRTLCESKIVFTDVAMSRGVNNQKIAHPFAMIFDLENNGKKISSIDNV